MDFNDFSKLSLYELGKRTNTTATMWWRYFHGKSSISERTLNKASQALQTSSEELLTFVQLRRKQTSGKKII
jgi:transcriptional regulator with XRE-family HTH domain